MGDVVLGETHRRDADCAGKNAARGFRKTTPRKFISVIAKEECRPDRPSDVQTLREAGFRVDFSLTPDEGRKTISSRRKIGARVAILFGDEWPGKPQVKFKTLATGEEFLADHDLLLHKLDDIKLTVEEF